MKADPNEILDDLGSTSREPEVGVLWKEYHGPMGAVLRNDQIAERVYETEDGELVRVTVTVAEKPPADQYDPDNLDLFEGGTK
jgi:hypothetical protein